MVRMPFRSSLGLVLLLAGCAESRSEVSRGKSTGRPAPATAANSRTAAGSRSSPDTVLAASVEAPPAQDAGPRPARPPGGITAGYHRYDELAAALQELVAASGGSATLESIAKSRRGRDVWALQVAAPSAVPPEKRQALLIVGGIDADHPAGSETALNVARKVVDALRDDPDADVAKSLAKRTLYIIPRVNPDGVETFFDPVRRGGRVNAHSIDNDRDGVANEDGPNDLNGDRMITVMRVPDPAGEWMVDPDEPRLLKKADRNKDERGVYKLVAEGVDDDNDGRINEDGPGGVDLDRNFSHLFESGTLEVGIHQLSEPVARALADYVIARPNIAAAIVYGRHDNLVKVPRGKERGPAGSAYKDLHPDDVKLYEHISKKYKEITALKESHGATPDGAFYAWLYAQRGIPTFATSLWWPELPKKEEPASQPASQPASAPAGEEPEDSGESDADAADEPSAESDELPSREEMMTRFRERFGNRQPSREDIQTFMRKIGGTQSGARIVIQRGGAQAGLPGRPTRAGGGRRGRGRSPDGAPADAGESKPDRSADLLAARVENSKTVKHWLKYSDELRDGRGFVEWTEFDHPTLGKVEIGGLAPYFTTPPPAEALGDIADKQIEFLVQLSNWLPSPRFATSKVTDAGGGLWQVEIHLINDGLFATHAGITRHIRMPAWVIRPQIERDRIVGGRPVERVANLDGGGGSAKLRWLIRGSPGSSVEFTAYSRTFGELKTSVVLRATAPGQEGK